MSSLKVDTDVEIQQCLKCEKRYCTNCLEHKGKSRKEKIAKVPLDYERRLSKLEYGILKEYPTANSDEEIAERLGRSRYTVMYARGRLRLPSAHKYSEDERRQFVAPWMEKRN